MNALLDIVSATLIGGLILLSLLIATDTLTTEFFSYNADAYVQENLANISEIMQVDIRKMGYGIPETQMASILKVYTPNHLRFISNLNKDRDYYAFKHGNIHIDTVPDTIEYRIVPFETITYYDTALVTYSVMRRVSVSSETPENHSIGVIGNNNVFRYMDQVGNVTGNPATIKMVEVTITAHEPRIVLSKQYIHSKLEGTENSAYRKQELRRLLRPSYWRQTRLVSKNLRR